MLTHKLNFKEYLQRARIKKTFKVKKVLTHLQPSKYLSVHRFVFRQVRCDMIIMITKSTFSLLLLMVLARGYDITIGCSSSGCVSGCKQCQVLSGGPFEGISNCVDKQGGCNKNSSYTISFNCKGCSNGNDCLFTWVQAGSSYSGCTNGGDRIWLANKFVLDGLYSAIKQASEPYDWCGASCGLSTAAIVGIVVGVVASLGLLGTGICCFLKRRKRSTEGYHKHSSSMLG